MPIKTTLLLATCLFVLAPIACTAEEGDGGNTSTDATAGGSEESGKTASAGNGAAAGSTGDASEGVGDDMEAQLRAALREERPQLEITSIHATPVDNIYEVVSGGRIFYVTADARYVFSGNLIDLDAQRNLTNDRQADIAHGVIENLDVSDMVVFEPADGPAKEYLTVFTDHTCPYCQRLHEEVLSMVQDYPVEVRYAMYPRAGTDSAAADTMRDIWCAENPTRALTQAKEGRSVPKRDAGCKTPLQRHWDAAQEIGLRGTPYILVGDDGPIISGYRPKAQLLSIMGLDESASAE